ncbi:FAD-dependent thymidylate synthase [Corynebacterium flavescens]|uniref:FAD-dependent thymidylate synthase n=1 Tax=Corynebacterium flavescens TaxID=28028 RepID=UPI003FD0178D
MIVEPQITLLAHSVINSELADADSYAQSDLTDAEALTILIERTCFYASSFNRELMLQDANYLTKTLIEQKNWSIAEHATATLYFRGVSWNFAHQILRHKNLNFSELSPHLQSEVSSNNVLGPVLRDFQGEVIFAENADNEPISGSASEAVDSWNRELEFNQDGLACELEVAGFTRRQVNDAVGPMLSMMTENRIIVTGSLRAWYEVVEEYTQPDVNAEAQQVMKLAKEKLSLVSPALSDGQEDSHGCSM